MEQLRAQRYQFCENRVLRLESIFALAHCDENRIQKAEAVTVFRHKCIQDDMKTTTTSIILPTTIPNLRFGRRGRHIVIGAETREQRKKIPED